MSKQAILWARARAAAAATYQAKAVHFDHLTQLYRPNGAPLVGVTDSPLMTASWWFRFPTSNDLSNGSDAMYCEAVATATAFALGTYWNDPSDLNMLMGGYLDANQFYFGSPPGVVSPGAWVNVLTSVNTNFPAGSRIGQLYANDAPQNQINMDTGTAFNIPFSVIGQGFGINNFFGEDGFALEFADVMLWPSVFTDFSQVNNRRLFIDANGKPVNPSVAVAALGTPAILFSGDASGFSNNQGYGGDFEVMRQFQPYGSVGSGPVDLYSPGATIGQTVWQVFDETALVDQSTGFETSISVTNQIQQFSASDLSGDIQDVYVVAGALTNATTSPSD
jgi:hypothetical protein